MGYYIDFGLSKKEAVDGHNMRVRFVVPQTTAVNVPGARKETFTITFSNPARAVQG